MSSFSFLDTFESIELDQVQLIELTNLHLDFAEILSRRTLLFCGTSPGLSGENPFQDPIASLLRWESWDFQKKILENLDHIHKERMRIRRQWVSRPRDALGWKTAWLADPDIPWCVTPGWFLECDVSRWRGIWQSQPRDDSFGISWDDIVFDLAWRSGARCRDT